jgi:hypothetical protein
MPAATTDRNTRQRAGLIRNFPVAASTKLLGGTIVALNASGLLVNPSASNALKSVGVVQQTHDNSAGLAGAISAEVHSGVWGPFDNSAAADAIALADVGADCWLVDNQTVAKTSASNTRSVAGKISHVSSEGVWVFFQS